ITGGTEALGHVTVSGGYILNLNANKTMPAIAQDCSKILDAIEKLPIYSRINSSQIGLIGHSLGGMVVLMNGALDPRFKVTVAWSPLVNFDLRKLGLSENGTYAKYLPINLINETRPSNLMLIADINDPIVSYKGNALLAQNLTNCKLVTLKGNYFGGAHYLMTDVTLYKTINWFEFHFFGSETINGPITISFYLNYVFLFISLAMMFVTILGLIDYFSIYFRFDYEKQINQNSTLQSEDSKKFRFYRILKILFYFILFIILWSIFYVNFSIFGLLFASIFFFVIYSVWSIQKFLREKKSPITREFIINKVKDQFRLNEMGYSVLGSSLFLGFYLLFTISYPFAFQFPSSFLDFIFATAGFPIYLSLEVFYRKVIYPKLNFIRKERYKTIIIIISIIAVQFILYGLTWNWSILPGVLTTHIVFATVLIINTFVYEKTRHFSSVFIVSYLIIQIFFGAGISQILGIRNILSVFL
ncbi:MAG: hypothetical protein P8Y97_19990, partial [Candidatus Lokiarchaeota archaeon]